MFFFILAQRVCLCVGLWFSLDCLQCHSQTQVDWGYPQAQYGRARLPHGICMHPLTHVYSCSGRGASGNEPCLGMLRGKTAWEKPACSQSSTAPPLRNKTSCCQTHPKRLPCCSSQRIHTGILRLLRPVWSQDKHIDLCKRKQMIKTQ